jgi:hypothetical protein
MAAVTLDPDGADVVRVHDAKEQTSRIIADTISGRIRSFNRFGWIR